MFGLLTQNTKSALEPLTSTRAASSWVAQLPPADLLARQQQTLTVFDSFRNAQREVDLGHISALHYLDAALGADRRKLVRQFVGHADAASVVANRLWQALYDLSQSFIVMYQSALEQALAATKGAPKWSAALPLLFDRLIHFYGTDAKLRVFRYERWIPGKWSDLHQAYLRACEAGVARTMVALPLGATNITQWSPEQEYLYVLMIHQLNTGNLTPAQLDWASSQLRAWSRRLELDEVPKSAEGFLVDLGSRSGLTRRNGADRGSMLRYLDTTPLAEALERARAGLQGAGLTEQGTPSTAANETRLAVLQKIFPALAPATSNELRRGTRVNVAASARVRIGLSRICQDVAGEHAFGTADNTPTEHIEVFPVAGAPRVKRVSEARDELDSLSASLSSWSDPLWEVRDRSVAGLRIAASGGIGQSLVLGALVGVRQLETKDWLLGAVRRLNKITVDDVEAGVQIIAERLIAVSLHAKRKTQDDQGYSVDGANLSTVGERFDALYLPPPSRPDKPLAMKTLIIPTSEYANGRQLMLSTGRSIYTVELKHLVEQRPEWSWATVQIIEKRAKN